MVIAQHYEFVKFNAVRIRFLADVCLALHAKNPSKARFSDDVQGDDVYIRRTRTLSTTMSSVDKLMLVSQSSPNQIRLCLLYKGSARNTQSRVRALSSGAL